MTRKRVDFKEIYDARALRVVVDDMGGQREAAAMAACYRLLPAVHRLWRPIWGETDDYIANPKVLPFLLPLHSYSMAVVAYKLAGVAFIWAGVS